MGVPPSPYGHINNEFFIWMACSETTLLGMLCVVGISKWTQSFSKLRAEDLFAAILATAKNRICKKGERLGHGDPQLGTFTNTISEVASAKFHENLLTSSKPSMARLQALCAILTGSIGRMDDGLLLHLADLCYVKLMPQVGTYLLVIPSCLAIALPSPTLPSHYYPWF